MGLLDGGSVIEARLKAKCPTASCVLPEVSLAGVKEVAQKDASLYVVLHSYKPLPSDSLPDRQWEENYLVVAVVNNAAQVTSPAEVQKQAATLLAEVLVALDGWRSQPAFAGALEAIPGPAILIENGWGYFPLAFKAKSVTSGCVDNQY